MVLSDAQPPFSFPRNEKDVTLEMPFILKRWVENCTETSQAGGGRGPAGHQKEHQVFPPGFSGF